MVSSQPATPVSSAALSNGNCVNEDMLDEESKNESPRKHLSIQRGSKKVIGRLVVVRMVSMVRGFGCEGRYKKT